MIRRILFLGSSQGFAATSICLLAHVARPRDRHR